jgi:hypothetical protein
MSSAENQNKFKINLKKRLKKLTGGFTDSFEFSIVKSNY